MQIDRYLKSGLAFICSSFCFLRLLFHWDLTQMIINPFCSMCFPAALFFFFFVTNSYDPVL